MINFREFTVEDIPKVLAMWISASGVKLHSNGEDSEQGIEKSIRRNTGLSFLAEDNGEIVGAVLNGNDGRRGYVYHLYVKEEYRKQGIATRLLKMTEDSMNEAGIRKLALFVLNDNQAAQKFYRDLEWIESDEVKTFAKIIQH